MFYTPLLSRIFFYLWLTKKMALVCSLDNMRFHGWNSLRRKRKIVSRAVKKPIFKIFSSSNFCINFNYYLFRILVPIFHINWRKKLSKVFLGKIHCNLTLERKYHLTGSETYFFFFFFIIFNFYNEERIWANLNIYVYFLLLSRRMNTLVFL